MQLRTKKIATLGLLLALALILSYVESLIPVLAGIPGVKLGLANLLIVLCLYVYGWRDALLINCLRIILSGFLFGNMFSILYSLAGAAMSFIMMCLVKKTNFMNITGVSVIGGVFHNIGQIIVAVFLLAGINMLYYIPALLVSGMLTGLVNGMLARLMYNRRGIWNRESGI